MRKKVRKKHVRGRIPQRDVAAHLFMNVTSVANLITNNVIPPLSDPDTTLDSIREAYIEHLRSRGRNQDFNDARARHEAAKAGKAELALQVETGEMVPGAIIDEAFIAWATTLIRTLFGSAGKIVDAARTAQDRRRAISAVRPIIKRAGTLADDAARAVLEGDDEAA